MEAFTAGSREIETKEKQVVVEDLYLQENTPSEAVPLETFPLHSSAATFQSSIQICSAGLCFVF